MSAEKTEIPVVPRLAAAIVLLREAGSRLEALMLQRSASMAFAAGEWAFPGGAVDVQDRSEDWLKRIGSARQLSVDARALRIAACRETYEEAAVLLGRNKEGSELSHWQFAHLAEIAAEPGQATGFADLLTKQNLALDLNQLTQWSNWITPPLGSRRFDTHFFIAPMPPDQSVVANARESQAAAWVPVDDMSAMQPPIGATPALYTLRELALVYRQCGSLAALREWAAAQPTATIMVKLTKNGERLRGLLPWDADYENVPGEGVQREASLLQRFGGLPSRFELDPVTKVARFLV
jgi:8-oxo-dGTP pyrophosphatase MutT (NUDIX family)